jgi:hypothetical protein
MNPTRRWLAKVRPRHNPAENALIVNMRDDRNIPWLNSLAAMHHYARQRWPHDPAVQSLIPGGMAAVSELAGTTTFRCSGTPRGLFPWIDVAAILLPN